MEYVVKISPVALFSIIDAYERRSEINSKVVGTLLGYIENQNIVVTSSFAIPFNVQNDEVFMSVDFNQNMVMLNQRVNSNVRTVGWYSTGSEITDHSKLIHEDYYQKLCKKNTIYLLVDTSLQALDIPIKAFVSRNLGISGKSGGVMFVPVPVEIYAREPETFALSLMSEGLNNKKRTVYLKDELTNVIDLTKNILDMITVVHKYVADVLNGKIKPDHQIGRKLAQVVLSVPKIDKEKLDKLVLSSSEDMLMYMTLLSMMKTELKITEKALNQGY